MRKIPLTQGQFALVDNEDFDWLSQWKWCAHWNRSTKSFYAIRSESTGLIKPRQREVSMHRQILRLKHGNKNQADHINHKTLDNRRKNIRSTTCRGNNENRRNKSKYGPGIHKRKDCKFRPFETYINIDGVQKYIGCFSTVQQAQKARNQWIKKHEIS